MPAQTDIFSLYGGDVKLEFESGRHIYLANGQKVESITGILKVISKNALIYWAVNMACEYMSKNITPGVALDELQIASLLDGAKKAHRTKSTDAATTGTMIHDWISKHLKGQNPPLPVNEKIKNACQAFLRFEEEHKIQVIDSERKVFSKKLNVAGTCDFYGTYEGEPVVADIKTGSAIYPEAILQTAGYDICLNEEDGTEFKYHLVINCSKDGVLTYHLSDKVEENKKGFRAAVDLCRAITDATKQLKESKV